MYITRKQSLVIAVVIIVGFTVSALGLSSTKRDESINDMASRFTTERDIKSEAETAKQGESLQPDSFDSKAAPEQIKQSAIEQFDAAMMLKTFRRFESRDGKTVWEFAAKQGKYSPERESAIVSEVDLTLYREKDERINLKADEAVIALVGTTLKTAELKGNVKVTHSKGATLQTDFAVVEYAENRVTAPGLVRINGDLFEIQGEQLEGKIDQRNFTLKKNVSTVIYPQDLRKSSTEQGNDQ